MDICIKSNKKVRKMTNSFIFEKYNFNKENGVLSLHYLSGGYHFEEIITFPNAPFDADDNLVDECVRLLHLAAGISYYKALLPENIEIKTSSLSKKEADFFNHFYISGLGQFAVENNLNLQDKINFPFVPDKKEKAFNFKLGEGVFVPVGGGKDSCVTIELFKEKGIFPTLISVNSARPISDCKKASGLDEITISRKLSPVLLNNNHLFFNGHVPITGILAFVLLLACVLYKKNEVAMSCEKSANEGNLMQGDLSVNHQWSKSEDFEKSFNDLVRPFASNFSYHSVLRSYYEIDIARLFAQKCSDYFDVFTSCNKAFKIDEKNRLDRWCGCCDKCRFVFLILAPFMDKKRLVEIVGRNPLDDQEQIDGYLELLGLSGHKPFECVGTVSECRQAFDMIKDKQEWKNDFIIKELNKYVK